MMIKSLYISYNAITEPIVQSQVIPYLKGLSKKGIKFYLLTFEKKRIRNEERAKIKGDLKKEFGEEPGFEWLSLNYHRKPTVPATFLDILMGYIFSIYLILKDKIDIIHARAVVAALAGFPAARMLGKKFIFDTRGIDSEEYVDAGTWKKGGFKHKVVGFLEDKLIKSSDHVVVLTERFSDILKKKHLRKEEDYSVIPCAVDTDKFRLRPGKNITLTDKLGIRDKFVIAYVGSLGTWYMFKEMLDFFKIALKVVKNAHFLLLTQTDKGHAVNTIKNTGLDMKDFTVDTVSHKAVPDYLSVCDAGIFFIKPVFSKLSSSPTKFGEYLASALPVIANRGIGDTDKIMLRNNVGVVVEGFNEEGYRNALVKLTDLLKDADLADRCRSTAEKYLSLTAAIDKYNGIYKILDTHHTRL